MSANQYSTQATHHFTFSGACTGTRTANCKSFHGTLLTRTRPGTRGANCEFIHGAPSPFTVRVLVRIPLRVGTRNGAYRSRHSFLRKHTDPYRSTYLPHRSVPLHVEKYVKLATPPRGCDLGQVGGFVPAPGSFDILTFLQPWCSKRF